MTIQLIPEQSAALLELIQECEAQPGVANACVLAQAVRRPWPDCNQVEVHFAVIEAPRATRIKQILQQPTNGKAPCPTTTNHNHSS